MLLDSLELARQQRRADPMPKHIAVVAFDEKKQAASAASDAAAVAVDEDRHGPVALELETGPEHAQPPGQSVLEPGQ